jgi:hypothetical protein
MQRRDHGAHADEVSGLLDAGMDILVSSVLSCSMTTSIETSLDAARTSAYATVSILEGIDTRRY